MIKIKEKYIQTALVIITVMMTILRILLNEKGRMSPDSVRFLRFAKVFPTIDNTLTPIGYPVFIKFFTFFGTDEFWSSKLVGLLSFLAVITIAGWKKFFFREAIIVCSLFSFVSIFSATLSEALLLPFVLILIYISSKIINGNWSFAKSLIILSAILIASYNIRYNALFLMGGAGIFGLLSIKKDFGKVFLSGSVAAFIFVVLYQLLFVRYFNENYIDEVLELGLRPTLELLPELFTGLATSFNPFIHITNPSGGIINFGILGIGFFTILAAIILIIKFKVTPLEQLMITFGISGVVFTYFIQYFYWIDALDYRLLCPFTFPVWLVFFKKLFLIADKKTYIIAVVSLMTGFAFIVLSKGNYLENRESTTAFLKKENLLKKPIQFYIEDLENLEETQLSELVSTVNSNLTITFKASDTLKKTTLTRHKVLQKIKIDKNKYQ